MVNKCCVPGCMSNYKHGRKNFKFVSVFEFPKDPELKDKWIRKIPKENLVINKNTVVCEGHFHDCDILRHDIFPGKEGCPDTIVPRKRKKLKVGAIPSFFPNIESYLPFVSHRERRRLEEREENSFQRFLENDAKLLGVQNDCKSEIDGWIATDKITGFTLFCDEAKHYLGGNKWMYELDDTKEGQECIRYILLPYLPTLEKNSGLFTITVTFDMTVKLFSKSTGDIPDSSLSWIFGNEDEPPVLEYWSQFVTLVSQCSTGVWVDGNDDIQRVYIINDLHQLFPDVEDEAIISSNTASCNSEEKNTESIGDNICKDDRRLQILGLTQELYRVIFQRNQLIKKMQHLQELAIIDVDVFSLILGVDVNPEGKTELDKVSKLVQTITNDLEIGGNLNVLLPLLVKQYWSLMDDDNPFQNKPLYIPNNSSLPQDKSEIRVDDITGEMNGDSNCGVIKDDNISDQSLVVNTLQAEEQENQVDEDLNENSNNDSHISNSKIEDDSSLKTIVFKNYGKRVSSYSLRQQIWTKHNQEQENQVDEVKDLDENIKDPHLPETNSYGNSLKTKSSCEFCGKCIKSSNLNRHVLTKHNQELNPELLLSCNICGKKYFKFKSLNSHLIRMHGQGIPRECSICGKQFENRHILKLHFNIHHTNQRPLQCAVCGKTFKWHTTFRRHCLSVHTEERPFKCSFCNKGFKIKCFLKVHEENVHINVKEKKKGPRRIMHDKNRLGTKMRDDEWSGLFEFKKGEDNRYYCIVCNKSFPLWSRLKTHMMVLHADKRAFKCDTCGKSFKVNAYLARHIKMVHLEGGTLYQCSLCPKKFKIKHLLKNHQEVHTEREPFKCTLCDKTFKWFRSLQKHEVVHSKKTPVKQGCGQQDGSDGVTA